MIKDIIDLTKMGIFYIDNVIVNDIIVQIIYNRLRSDISDSRKRRVKRLKHIINLVVTARHTEERRELLKVWIAIYRKY
jgi:hypothetical protein